MADQVLERGETRRAVANRSAPAPVVANADRADAR